MLVITDHETHKPGESIYPLLSCMTKNRACASLDIASRGNEKNASFFVNNSTQSLYVHEISSDFIFEKKDTFFSVAERKTTLDTYDIIFLRIDRPFSILLAKHIRTLAKTKLIINEPAGILKTGSKKYLLNYQDFCPPLKICRSIDDIKEFCARYPTILKPFESYGGKGIIRITNDIATASGIDYPIDSYWKILEQKPFDGCLAMKYLKDVHLGDKRIIVVNKTILGATLRRPPEHSFICNLEQGGSSEFATIDDREACIAEALTPQLIKEGILFYGFDTLVDNDGKRVLSEINTLNVGGLYEVEYHSGKPVIKIASDLIWDYIIEKKLPH